MAPPTLLIYDPAFDNATAEEQLNEYKRLNASRPYYLSKCNEAYKEFEAIVTDLCPNGLEGPNIEVDSSDQSVARVAANFKVFNEVHEVYKAILVRQRFLLGDLQDPGTYDNGQVLFDQMAKRILDQSDQVSEQRSGLQKIELAQTAAREKREQDHIMQLALIRARADARAKAEVAAEMKADKRARRQAGEPGSSDDDGDAAASSRKRPCKFTTAEVFRPKSKLELDHDPVFLDDFKEEVRKFIQRSDTGDDPDTIKDIFESCISASVKSSVAMLCDANTPVFPPEGGGHSRFAALDAIWLRRYPLNTLREQLFDLELAENQSFDEYLVLQDKLAGKAQAKKMTYDDFRPFLVLKGIRKAYPNVLDKLVMAGKCANEVTIDDITKLVHATQSLAAYTSAANARAASCNRLVNRGRGNGGGNQPAFMSLTGPDKLKAMHKEGYCIKCAKKHTGECRFADAQCDNCDRQGHIKRACSKPLRAAPASGASAPSGGRQNARRSAGGGRGGSSNRGGRRSDSTASDKDGSSGGSSGASGSTQ